MSPEFAGELAVNLGILAVLLFVLGIGALVADFVFPRIPFIENWLESLPEFEDDEEIARQYEEARRMKRAERRRRMAARKAGR